MSDHTAMQALLSSEMGETLRGDADLTACNTFAVPARAAWLAQVEDPAHLPELMAAAGEAGLPRLVLGGGSNVLFTGDYPGLVLLMANRGITVEPGESGHDRVRVAAGENWDAFVRWSLAQGYCGLENLILIPGSVGAAPIQNIGAYGVEVAAFIDHVRVWDRETGAFRELSAPDCRFAYRDSLFKQERDRYVVVEVSFRLPKAGLPRLDYRGIREMLAERGIQEPSAADVAAVVEALRRSKLPDPSQTGNAGSFFKNPVVPLARAEALRRQHPDLPLFELPEGQCKLSAAWLIERAGLKGWRQGAAGVSERHALVLVNHGGASGAEVWAVARTVMDTVADRFGVQLEPEPLVL
ncbi:UDP-N-acetylmuramate dehydrogenase [Natronospira bacteriovora]|uniref:UDP-N-acetylenolpyruvoylglucosamine reductase n=1 Tax=Natronospira bacteriovora TaxID=3069753 RepID=A0ABU0W7R6_9GAMM|nr:UDP-N-acetylmuramate dehydrogenase [Natronospira sp. AB-CW4]MDQ2070074.1 UDP-N-acetylmuramate dehydrogenase [Natronospira sp. AB-CW4]